MTMTTNIHTPNFLISDLYSEKPGFAINIVVNDGNGNTVTVFADDKSIRQLVVEIQRYANHRDAPPVEPAPTYAEALFETVTSNDDGIAF